MRLRTLVALVLTLALSAPSCGGDPGVFATSPTIADATLQDLIGDEPRVVADAVVGHLGPDGGLRAVGYALDRGYTAAQIATAAPVGSLSADGTIAGAQPTFPLRGIFADLPEETGSGSGGGHRPGPAHLRLADEPNPYETRVTADQWSRSLAAEFDAVVSGRPTPSAPSSGGSSSTTMPPQLPDGERAAIMIGLILELSDLGYSAEQIILGIVLGEVRITLAPSGLGPIGCPLLEDSTTGTAVRPDLPATPGAFSTTNTCREAINRLLPDDDSSSSSTTTTLAVADADGIPDGSYTGEVDVTGPVTEGAVYDIVTGRIRLEVTDQVVRAEVEYTLRVSVRSRLEGPVCIATLDYRYAGEQATRVTLGFPLQPVSQSIRLLEGPECGIVDPWNTTAEDYLLAGFAEERTITLSGSFDDGSFDGYVSGTPLGVTARIGE